MKEHGTLVDQFEHHRSHLYAVAYRMLGSGSEAEDAVQESWLRLSRAEVGGVENLGAWLRTVVSRVCLDMLRARRSRHEVPAGLRVREETGAAAGADPEEEALRAESVGQALLVVLGRLSPAERVAFVLHDLFAMPFEEIAAILERSPVAAKQLASRARRRVHGAPTAGGVELARARAVVEAFLAAARAGDVNTILQVLAPDVVRRGDRSALPLDRPAELRGARTVAREIAMFGTAARFAEPALVDGAVGIVVASQGRLQLAVTMTTEGEKIVAYELIGEPTRLERLDLALLPA